MMCVINKIRMNFYIKINFLDTGEESNTELTYFFFQYQVWVKILWFYKLKLGKIFLYDFIKYFVAEKASNESNYV